MEDLWKIYNICTYMARSLDIMVYILDIGWNKDEYISHFLISFMYYMEESILEFSKGWLS